MMAGGGEAGCTASHLGGVRQCGAHNCSLAAREGPDRHAERDQAQSANTDTDPVQPRTSRRATSSAVMLMMFERILGEQNCVFDHG